MDLTVEKEIITKLSVNELETLIKTIDKTEQHCLLLKFTASWCGPCKTIKPICDKYFKSLPENVIISEIDIDESMDLLSLELELKQLCYFLKKEKFV